MHPIPPPSPPIKYKPGAESGSSVAFSLGDAQPNPLLCPSVSGTMSLDPEGSPIAGRDPTSGRRLSSEGCDLRRPINTAKAKAAWVMVPMGSSSRYVKSAGSPLAPPTPTGPRGPSSSHHNQSGALQLIAKWQNPKTNILIALLGWDVPHSTVQACGRHRDMFLPVQPGQCSKGARDTVLVPGHWWNYEGSLQALWQSRPCKRGTLGSTFPQLRGDSKRQGSPSPQYSAAGPRQRDGASSHQL